MPLDTAFRDSSGLRYGAQALMGFLTRTSLDAATLLLNFYKQLLSCFAPNVGSRKLLR